MCLQEVNSLGYKSDPPVKHEKHFRDPSTGFHTNDAESENNRLKKWSRTRYGKLQLNASEMDEYVFYVNVGSSMCDVLCLDLISMRWQRLGLTDFIVSLLPSFSRWLLWLRCRIRTSRRDPGISAFMRPVVEMICRLCP